jgi:hypothetical protein
VNANLGGADLSKANLNRANLLVASLIKANLNGASLSRAFISGANLSGANLSGANLSAAILSGTNLSGANLSGANLLGANFMGANLRAADLSGADLGGAILVETILDWANLTNCQVYGISAWKVSLEGSTQSNLVITPPEEESVIQVDNLEVAQFVYLLLNNEKIRHVIDTITSKVVLILGSFTRERKVVLDTIREELRKRDYLPILFDFEKPASKDRTGTVSTLANLARFIIADLTEPSSVPHELATVAPGTVVPIQTILLERQREYAMFPDLVRRYHWVLEPYQYTSKELLIASLNERVIAPAEAKAKQIARK